MTASPAMSSTSSSSGINSKEDGTVLARNTIRKVNKPLVEKRRRARINQSLSELKELVVHESKEDKIVKLEKADVLDLAISYLRKLNLDRQTHLCFNDGFKECLDLVVKFLEKWNCPKTMRNELFELIHFREEHGRRYCSLISDIKETANVDPREYTAAFSLTMKNNISNANLRKGASPRPSLINRFDNNCHQIIPKGESFLNSNQSFMLSDSLSVQLESEQPLDLSQLGSKCSDHNDIWRPWCREQPDKSDQSQCFFN